MAELRNRRYGTGHGQASAPNGLGARHAHFAANAALIQCELTLDTLHDPEAPWRKARAGGHRWLAGSDGPGCGVVRACA
ncbi:abortive infection family protein [Kitasatospora purpeofusca]|uniref:abortive infection family protein n=1 Tax=Kitasatospora purpeofusca TaxID=67352 RepID=UPI003F4A99E9